MDGFPSQAASHHDAEALAGGADWRPAGAVHRFHDYSAFRVPWLSTAAAVATWGATAYLLIALNDVVVAMVIALGALLMSVVAYAGWHPKDRVEIDPLARRLLRVSPDGSTFSLAIDDITRIDVDKRREKNSERYLVIALPMRCTIYSARQPARATSVARRLSALTDIPFRDTSAW